MSCPSSARRVLDVAARAARKWPHRYQPLPIAPLTFPARFQLIAAMNPRPCGYFGDSSGRCRCSTEQVRRYQGQTSGPLLDRIDLHVEVQQPCRRACCKTARQESHRCKCGSE